MLATAPNQATTNDGTLTGPVDGSNPAFTLSPPVPPQQEWVFRNGLLMTQGLDVAMSGATAALISAQIPPPGDVISAAVWGTPPAEAWQPPFNLPAQFSTNDGSIIGVLNGANNVFTLATGLLVTGIVLFFNGLQMTPNVDFTWSCLQVSSAGPWSTTIAMMAGNNPNVGDVLTGQIFNA